MDNGCILCVDDDTTVLIALRTLLAHAMGQKHMIEIAESGEEALEILEDLQQNGQHLSIVISDFIMPGMRGDELLIDLHRRSPQTITIMLTGQSDFEGVKKAINHANLYRFLEKPFNHDDIILTVKSAFQAYEQEQTLRLQNTQLRQLNGDLELALKKVQESEKFLETRVAQRTTELDEKNKALQQALRTLEDVDRIARHDLKTPLVSIAAAPNLLRSVRTMTPFEDDVLNMIESASNRALSMVNLSLDLFRMESGSYVFRPAAIDLCAIAKSVVIGLTAHARSKFVSIKMPQSEARVYVAGDDSLCYSIIGNLMKNAVEAAPEHSVVTIEVYDAPTVVLSIHNQGSVPQSLRASFFEKYATSGKQGGTGLGTYSSYLLAKVQNGVLAMETSDSDGTTLRLSLNQAQVTEQKTQSQKGGFTQGDQSKQHVSGLCVLLVDDDDFNQMVMSEYIPQPQFELDTAINGRMAMEQAMEKRPDLIIMDLEMPIMGGMEAMKRIREYQEKTSQLPSYIVAYSGNDDEASQINYLAQGFDACLSKPSTRDEILDLFEAVLRARSN